MTINSKNQRNFARRHITSLFIMAILLISGLTPFLFHFEIAATPPAHITEPIGTYSPLPININTVAGEPNFTRDSWPFIIDNYPNFNWKNPGCFNGSQDTAGNILINPTRTTAPGRGYDYRMKTVGTGAAKYSSLFNSISGLNESNIRIMYLDADYNWVSVPYQIDQRGWANVWYPADLNKFGGLEAAGTGGATGSIWSNGAGNHIAADMIVGLGYIAGDIANSEGLTNYGAWTYATGANNIQDEWYRIPIWTFVSPRQPDGSITNENLKIDPEYRDNLIWCYQLNASRPHTAWLSGDTNALTNDWNVATGGASGRTTRTEFPQYAEISRNTWRPAFVNTTTWVDTLVNPTTGANNLVFMGDTWFTTPGNYTTTAGGRAMPTWVKTAFPYTQINGAVDPDDEICFYTYNGRQSPSWLWWNYSYFPQRYEMQIVDPVDGGRTWMYIYYNNATAVNPLKGGINLGAPKFTTTDKDGNPIDYYCSWDPSTAAITTDYYRTSFNTTYPNVVAGVQMFGDTDGQSILNSFGKMYMYGHVTMVQSGQTALDVDIALARQGTWYRWPGTTTPVTVTYNELFCSLDNPSVWYPGISRDNSIMMAYSYGGGQYTADRRALSFAPQSPQNYYGPRGVVRGHTPAFQIWGQTQGDQRAIISGPCRVMFYYQSFLSLGVNLAVTISGTVILNDDLDIIFPIMDGIQVYYRTMQISPDATVEIPSIAGATISIYYAYIECGSINLAVRNDLTVTAAQEWGGGTNGVDNNKPKFTWANNYGWYKLGGLDPKTTSYTVLGYSYFNASRNGTNYYASQGNPLLQVTPVANPLVCPADGNNLRLPDWAIVTSETHGGVWLYIPRREANESRDNNGLKALPMQLKMYFRDDGGPSSHPEFGICLDGGASPWILGGTSTSPYHLMMVYGEWKGAEAVTAGHKLYCNYYFPLEGTTTFSGTPSPGPRFVYSTAQPNKLVYKTGEKIQLFVTGTPKNATIYVNGRNIHSADPSMATMTNRGDGSWNYTYTIDAVTSYASPAVTRYVNLTAVVPGVLWTGISTYLLNITIDNTQPAPTGQLATLTTPTAESSVYLSWAAIPGFDKGCSSMANPKGLGGYIIQRGIVSGTYDTNLTAKLPITTTYFVDSFIENGKTYYYRLLTFDEVGNVNASIERSTTINLPYTPAQPADLPATKNPTTSAMLIDWTANPGYGSGVTITGYHVFRSTSMGGTYTDISGQLASTVKIYTDTGPTGGFVEATTYYYKVLTDTASQNLYSAAVFTRIDRVAPAAAEIATPLPTYRSAEAEIIVSWAMEILPEYQTGGFPGQDLNGIDHWTVYKKIGTGSWKTLGTVPYGPLTEDQRLRDIAVVNGTTYSYAIRTFDTAGNSALCTANKTTKLWVIGPGKAEVHSVVAGSNDVKQGAAMLPITVLVRNPGTTSVTLNQVQLYFHKFNVTREINVTKDYAGTLKTDGTALAAYANRTFAFSVNVSTTANLGTITIEAQTLYDTTKKLVGATYPDSWVVTPDASLIIDTITSTKSLVNPGMKDIPVSVKVSNPGKSNAAIDSIALSFVQNGLDISDNFMVERLTSIPTSGFNRTSKYINFNVTVGQSVTAGGVTVNAIVTGSSFGVPLEDTDGATTPLTWAVQTSAKPVIASVVADQAVYWTGSVIRLTVTCDKAGHTVRGFFGPLDASTANETGTDNGDKTYTITHTLGTAAGENTYTATVYAQNASGVSKQTLGIRLGQAPTFSGWVQSPTDGNVQYYSIVDIDIEITDNGGAATVQAYLRYRIAGGEWNIRTMTHPSGTHWDVIIPAQTMGGLLEYIINATDTAGNWALYSKSYTVITPPVTPTWVTGSESTHQVGNPGVVYTDVNPAPRNTPIAYTATITTQFQEGPGAFFTVVVSAFDPIHHDWVSINSSVWLVNPSSPVAVTLTLTFKSADIPAGTLVTGQVYICTGLPENGGRTLAWITFSHTVS